MLCCVQGIAVVSFLSTCLSAFEWFCTLTENATKLCSTNISPRSMKYYSAYRLSYRMPSFYFLTTYRIFLNPILHIDSKI